MEKRPALGRGLGALIPEGEAPAVSRVLTIKTEQVKANPLQPRENFDEGKMEELVQSVREKGVIQPILVRQRGDYYEIIAGERRFRAATTVGIKEVPVIVKDVDDKDSLELALIENIQRQDLNPMEEARAYQYLMDKFSLTQEKVSEVLGRSRASVANTLRLLKLPVEIQEDIRQGKMSFAHGKALLEVEDANHVRRLAQEAIAKGLSVRELETLIKIKRPRSFKLRSPAVKSKDPMSAVLEEELRHTLATKVSVVRQKKRGHITIDFYSQEDLERIVKRITAGGREI